MLIRPRSNIVKPNFSLRTPARGIVQANGVPKPRPDFRILLVRHGTSIANEDPTLFTTMADHAIPLSPTGVQQAMACGEKIKSYFSEIVAMGCWLTLRYANGRPEGRNCRLWCSPYRRARETAKIIYEIAGEHITDVREQVLLGEQQFGLFEGVEWKELEKYYPNEVEYYRKASRFGGRFWARMPLGESRFDVCQRVHQAFGSLHRDAEKYGMHDLIVVSHGVTLRAFLMMWLDLTPEWFEAEPNPRNCSIRVIRGSVDRGYIYGGTEGKVSTSDPQDLLLKGGGTDVV